MSDLIPASGNPAAPEGANSTPPRAAADGPAGREGAGLHPVEEAIAAIARGEMVVVLDDVARENEGDLIFAAEKATPALLAFMIRHTSGLVCVSMPGERLDELVLPLMVEDNNESHRTAFTISVDYRHGTTTGISAADRAATLRALADPKSAAADFARPGHLFPLRARKSGVLARPGHTEAASDLARLAGLFPAGALCEIVNDDGTMARGAQLRTFAAAHSLACISIADLAAYRRRNERLVVHEAEAKMPTRHGAFTAHVYRSRVDGAEHIAMVKGDVRGQDAVLVRVHSECLTGDILGSLRCDCGQQLDAALARVEQEGRGVVLYLRNHEGRGVGLTQKIRAYSLQDQGRDTVEANLELGLPADARSYDVGAQILSDLGLTTIRLMSNNPAKFTALDGYDIKIVERLPLLTTPNAENLHYLRTKQRKMGHTLGLEGTAPAEVPHLDL